MKTKMMKCMALILSLVCILCFPVQASAVSQGTDGTELEVVQPEKLEVFLGQAWSGVEFQLRTDAGKYPDPIPVDEDGILRLEIGGSENYFLTCQASRVEIPEPCDETTSADESGPVDETEAAEETAESTQSSSEEIMAGEEQDNTETTEVTLEEVSEDTVPVTHIVIFVLGLVIAVAALVLLQMHQKRNAMQEENADDDL